MQFIKYRCVHCYNAQKQTETFDAVKDVHFHWQQAHSKFGTHKPFQYEVVEYVSCFHCVPLQEVVIGTHYEMIIHHKQHHPALPFAVVRPNDSKKCALCPYYSHLNTSLVAHFQTKHKIRLRQWSPSQMRRIKIPFRLSDRQLARLLDKQMHKKQTCGHCGAMYDTQRALRHHHSRVHESLKLAINELHDANVMHLICNCCNRAIDRNLYSSHIQLRSSEFSCQNCAYRTIDLAELVRHDRRDHQLTNTFNRLADQYKSRLKSDYLKTRVVFGNGLVVSKHNLLGTRYDDSEEFYAFTDNLVEIKRERIE